MFLQARHSGIAHLHGQVAPSDHDAVRHRQDAVQLRNGFGAFDLGDQAGPVAVGASHVAELAGHFHVGGVFGEAHRHIVGIEAHGRADVVHVLGRQGRCRQAAALLVDALVVGQLAAQLHGGVHLLAFDRVHGEHDQAIVEQEHIARFHVARQLFVIQAHTVDVTRLGARGVQHKGGTGLEHDFAFGKLADPDLGALQVGHDGHLAARALRGFAHQAGAVDVVLGLAVAEVQANHIDACADHGLQQCGIAGSRA